MVGIARVRISTVWLRVISTAALCVIAVLNSACSDSTKSTEAREPEAGTLTVSWVTPHEAEGSVRLTLEGPAVGAISAADPGDLVFSRSSGAVHSIVVLGTLGSGGLIHFEVPDVHQAQHYRADIVEVAAADSDELRGDLSGYEISVRRQAD